MSSETAKQSPVQMEVRQLMDRLRVLARALGFSNAGLAREADVPLASMVRYFHGRGEPKLEFLLAVVRALGLEVREFFEMVYPEPPAPTAARSQAEGLLGPIRAAFLPVPAEREEDMTPLRRADVEQMMAALRRDLKNLVESRDRQEPTSGKPRRGRK